MERGEAGEDVEVQKRDKVESKVAENQATQEEGAEDQEETTGSTECFQ